VAVQLEKSFAEAVQRCPQERNHLLHQPDVLLRQAERLQRVVAEGLEGGEVMLHILKIAGFILLGVLAVALFDIVVIFTIAMVRVVSERREKKNGEERSDTLSDE
jgi:hypothetical protein